MSRLFFVAVCVAFCPAVANALDPELNRPYQLEVVLRVAKHRLLTDVFKDQVERELHDSLQAAFGDLAEVKIIHDHPRLKEVEDRGLEKALDAWKDVSDTKTHFVLIDFQGGEYVIRARQHDGLTGQPSPVVREERLSDRELVARTAALLVDRDFGPVGTVTPRDDQTVQVAIKGGDLGVPLERWVDKDDVFALVQLNPAGGGLRSVRVPWALLQVQDRPQKGVCVCTLLHRYPNPLGAGQVRCLKLTTLKQKPLRLRIVQTGEKGFAALPSLTIQVRHHSFHDKTDLVQGVAQADGSFKSEKSLYDHIAFVTVVVSGNLGTQIPVPLLDERPVVCPINVDTGGDAPLFFRKKLWVQDVYTTFLVQSVLFKELKATLGQAEKRTQALARAQAGLKDLQKDIDNLTQQRQELMTAAQNLPRAVPLNLAEGDQVLKELQAARDKLSVLVADLDKTVREENDPATKERNAKLQQADLEEKDAEYGKALELFDQALAGAPESEKVNQLRTRVEKLRRDWTVKGPAHQQARKFIYETWPGLDLVREKDAVEEARKAFLTCKANGDRLSPQKLVKSTAIHAANLQKALAGLQPDINQDDQTAAESIKKVAEELNKLVKDVSAYLQQ